MKTKSIKHNSIIFFSAMAIFLATSFQVRPSVAAVNTIMGFFYYGGEPSLGMFNSSVSLVSNGVTIATASTETNGRYQFSNVPDGTYTLVPSTTLPWGGVNSTDSYLMILHQIEDIQLNGLRLIASDVNNSNYINALDALVAARRFTGLDGSFVTGDFYFETPVVTVIGGIISQINIHCIAYGDANASYQPGVSAKQEEGLSLEHSSLVEYNTGEEISIPVSIQQADPINAITLNLNYSQSQLEILSITNNIGQGNFVYHVSGGSVRISWYDVAPFQASEDKPSFTLRARVTNKSNSIQGISLGLDPGCEITGYQGKTTTNSVIVLPEIKVEAGVQQKATAMRVSPNPVINTCRVNFYSPQSQEGIVKVKNLLGAVVYQENFYLEGGNNTKVLSLDDMPKGIYIVEIWSDLKKLDSKKIVKS
jgi:hypothetical protein